MMKLQCCGHNFHPSLLRSVLWRTISARILALAFSIGLIACGAPDTAALPATSASKPSAAPAKVSAVAETTQMPHEGDAADDPAIWVHPSDPALSTVIGTDKKGGLAVYSLDGKQLQYLADGNMNNVDIRTGFPLGGQPVALVAASNRNNSIALYRVNPATRQLENIAARVIQTGVGYGACMYRSRTTGKFYYFGNSEQGEVEQWELLATSAGKVDAIKVRSFDVGSQTEGCVADDQLGHFYIGEEAKGIWKYGAEPSAGETRTQVDTTGSAGHLTADVEGLTIYGAGSGTGYLIASSQGDNTYVIYRREGDNAYIATFEIVAAGQIDGASQTDGIDVTSVNLGPAFPQGMFIAQDGKNDECNQNFKFVPWQSISAAISQTPSSASPAPPKASLLLTSSVQRHSSAAAAKSSSFLPIAMVSC